MKAETELYEGRADRPLVVFIHGMGMDVRLWSEPSEARILGGKYRLRVILRDLDGEMHTCFQDLRDLAYTVLSWSQTRPSGPIATAVTELSQLLGEYRPYTRKGILFVCHSRGGLIARKYLESGDPSVKGIVTIATPHRGSTMARWAVNTSPVASLIEQTVLNRCKKEAVPAFRRILRFLSSSGLKELLPESPFYGTLKDRKREDVRYVSIGGTNPDLIRVGNISLAEMMAKVLPVNLIPEELRRGHGDGMVSAASARLPHADEHHEFLLNHAALLFDRRVREIVIGAAESL